MNTSLTNHEGKLLVDIETGRVLRADDEITVTERYLDSHPFIARSAREDEIRTYFAGPDAARAAKARELGEGTGGLDVVEYSLLSYNPYALTLIRVEN